jgi:hypothetical protein
MKYPLVGSPEILISRFESIWQYKYDSRFREEFAAAYQKALSTESVSEAL